jgi:hypothetical protein
MAESRVTVSLLQEEGLEGEKVYANVSDGLKST